MPAPLVAAAAKTVGKHVAAKAVEKGHGGAIVAMVAVVGLLGLLTTGAVFSAAGALFGGGNNSYVLMEAANCQPSNALGAPKFADIPQISQVALNAYYEASQATGVKWELIAAIGTVESGNGTYGNSHLTSQGEAKPPIKGHVLDGSGVGGNTTPMYYSGPGADPSGYDRAVGPMQFLLSTWYGGAGQDGNGDGVKDPQNIFDAALAAGTKLRADGALTNESGAIFAYNHLESYVELVQKYENKYIAEYEKAVAREGTSAPSAAGPAPSSSAKGTTKSTGKSAPKTSAAAKPKKPAVAGFVPLSAKSTAPAKKKQPTANKSAPKSSSKSSSSKSGSSTPVSAPTAAANGCDGSLSTAGNPSGAVGSVLAYAEAQLGKAYVFGAAGPDSFDCSGLTMMAYRQVGVNLVHSAAEQWHSQPHVPEGQEQPGDLVFFPGDDGTVADPGHVGIVLDPAKHQMIDAPDSALPVEVDDYSHWPGGVVGFARPIIPNTSKTGGSSTSN